MGSARLVIPTKKKNKYRNKPTVVDGIRFQSLKEAARYGELLALVRNGKIFRLHLQPRFKLTVRDEVVGTYVADFEYWSDGNHIVEDVKGFKTPLYKWKKKHAEIEHGIVIVEI